MALPSFFSNDFLTIDIGFRYIKILQVRKKKNNEIMVVRYGIGDTPKGCIKNGSITSKDLVIAEIRKVMTENNINAREAKIVISGTNIITRILMIDSVPESEIDKVAWDEISSYMPINLNDHSVDYKVLGIVNADGQEKIKIFVTAVSKKIIGNYIEILEELGLKPLAVDTPANSVSKFFQKEIVDPVANNWARKKKAEKYNTNTFAVIDMGSETTIVNILNNKRPEFNRVLLIGSSNIDNRIHKTLDLEQKYADRAERYKRMYGIVRTKDQNNELEWQCSEAARSILDDILKQLKMCMDFYVTRCAGEQISKIYLIGGGSNLKGAVDFFEENLDVPIYPVKYPNIKGIEFSQGLDTEKVNFLINAVGIAQ